MKILHLTLHKEWFDLIARGKKKKEYRDYKPYWHARLRDREYDEIHFKNGYSKDAPFMRVEWKGCEVIDLHGPIYRIKLGKVLEVTRPYEEILTPIKGDW